MLQILAYVAQIAGGIGLLVAAATFLVHRNQLNFDVIMNCNQRFQEIVADLEAGGGQQEKQAKKRYVDLCNEQLFYFSNGYLPREVIEEWLDGMIYYLPLFDDVTGEVRSEHPGIVEPDLLEGYSRLLEGFAVDGSHCPTSREERMALARRIGKKVKPESILIVFWRDILDRFKPRLSQAGGGSRRGV
jgi:hypothetical protein